MVRSHELSSSVRDLAGLVRSVMAGEASEGVRIDAALAGFAIRRHRCGPLVALAVQRGAAADADAQALLRAEWEANKRSYLRNLMSGERIAAALAAAGIPALGFKGAALAGMLYPDPLARHCGDVDVLIAPGTMIAGLEALTDRGLRSEDPLLGLSPALLRVVLALTRDIALDDAGTQSHVELHSRLLFSKRLSNFLAESDATLRPRPVAADGQLPAPALGAGLALYLILHGCISGWCRLKWLADLIPLLDRLGPEGRQALADGAERSGTAAAVKASLITLRAAFGWIGLGPLDAWLAEPAGAAAVDLRAAQYAAWLGGEEMGIPMATRTGMLRSALLLDDRLSDRIGLFVASGLSSGVRQFAGALAPRSVPELRSAP